MVPAGGIDGVVEGGIRAGYSIYVQPIARRFVGSFVAVGSDGKFHVDNLIRGDYELQLLPGNRGVASPPLERVIVLANKRATTSVKLRKDGVTITVHVTGGPCEMVELKPPMGDLWIRPALAEQTCSGADAEISDVTPGNYRACAFTRCALIEVKPMPARQTFELVAPL